MPLFNSTPSKQLQNYLSKYTYKHVVCDKKTQTSEDDSQHTILDYEWMVLKINALKIILRNKRISQFDEEKNIRSHNAFASYEMDCKPHSQFLILFA